MVSTDINVQAAQECNDYKWIRKAREDYKRKEKNVMIINFNDLEFGWVEILELGQCAYLMYVLSISSEPGNNPYNPNTHLIPW